MVPVQAASPAGNVTFHRVRLKMTVGDGGGAIAQNDAEFEFSTPVSNGEVTWFDISSAFRAFADAYSPTPTAYVYPHLAANLNACDDYMIDGVSYVCIVKLADSVQCGFLEIIHTSFLFTFQFNNYCPSNT